MGTLDIHPLYEVLFGELHQPIERLTHLDVPHPYSPALEDAVRPNREKIAQTVRLMMKRPSDRRNSSQPLAMAT
jgi:pyruvate/2-oxoglutarate/acetoin dehydrogenase E1 component